MAVDYTTVALVASAKRRGFIPAGSGLSSSEILQILSEEMRNYIPAFLKGLREEYLVAKLEIPVTSGTVAAPPRAVGAAFRGVAWAQPNGNYPRPLNRIEPERVSGYVTADSQPSGYVLEGNNLLLVPGVTSGTVVLSYQQRPGQLVWPTACGLITALDAETDRVTFASTPSAFVDGVAVDVVPGTPNFSPLALDIELRDVGAGPNTWALAGFPRGLAIGDYVCLAGETPIPPLPTEVHDLLAQAGALKIAQATGSSRLDAIKTGLADLREQLAVILSPRSDGSGRPIVSQGVGYGRRVL